MGKIKTQYICQQCGYISIKWQGKCPDCQAWSSFSEEKINTAPAGAPTPEQFVLEEGKIAKLSEITTDHTQRISSKFPELDRILGGGIMPGGMSLIAGDPGIGKSTLLIQVAQKLAEQGHKILYASGEESQSQIKSRADRLSIDSDLIYLINETQLEKIVSGIDQIKPQFLVLDSIQTVHSSEFKSLPGSITQVKECTAKLINLCKAANISAFLIGHITKDGAIAGPKVLEHMVDTVIHFEGDKNIQYRILRALKNRFGSTGEVSIFEMTSRGLNEVPNPSGIFLPESHEMLPGVSIITPVQGSRVFFAESQALIGVTSYPIPKRTTFGIDGNKIAILAAILEKKSGLKFIDKDVFINVTGGFKVNDPGCDLGIVSAMVSSYFNKPLPKDLISIGELSLTGEIRNTAQMMLRLKESVKFGFRDFILPMQSKVNEKQFLSEIPDLKEAGKLTFVKNINEFYRTLF